MNTTGRAAAILAFLVCALSAVGQSAQFYVIHAPTAGHEILPQGISDDGSTVVGLTGFQNDYHALRWRLGTGMEFLWEGYAYDANADGSVVVGQERLFGRPEAAVRWTNAGLERIEGTRARVVSANGLAALIDTQSGPRRWTAAGSQAITPLPGGTSVSASDLSADGSAITGSVLMTAQGGRQPYRWTVSAGMNGLGQIPGSPIYDGGGNAVSADGAVIAGVAAGASHLFEAFRTTPTGLVSLGGPPEMLLPYPRDISGDGSVIVGALDFKAFIWTAEGGMRTLEQDLQDRFGLSLPGWDLNDVWAISADGTRLTGTAVSPLGERVGYMVVIPAPSSALALIAGGLLSRRRRSW